MVARRAISASLARHPGVAEQVDAGDLKSSGYGLAGSSPAARTSLKSGTCSTLSDPAAVEAILPTGYLAGISEKRRGPVGCEPHASRVGGHRSSYAPLLPRAQLYRQRQGAVRGRRAEVKAAPTLESQPDCHAESHAHLPPAATGCAGDCATRRCSRPFSWSRRGSRRRS